MQENGQIPPPGPGSPVPDRRSSLPSELGAALETLRQGRGGEPEAGALEAWLRPRLSGYFAACRAPDGELPDLVQEVLRRVFSGVGGLRDLASFEPWLFTIARNVARTRGERRGRDPLSRAEELSEERGSLALAADPDPESRLMASELVERVERAIRALPGRQRQCLLLQIRQELSYEEIGALLALSAHTVRNHLAEARGRLRQMLAEAEGPT